MKVQRINYEKLGLPVGPYVHSTLFQKTLYTSGLTAFGTDVQSASISEQAIRVFEQLRLIAAAHNATLKDLLKVTIFVTSFEDIVSLREALMNVYKEHKPASSMIKIDELFSSDLKIEIEAIFAV